MQIDTHLVNLSLYLPIFAGLVIGIIHTVIKSIKKVIKTSTLLTFVFDILFSIIIIIINLFVFYLSNYGKLRLYSLIIELVTYVIFRKFFGNILCDKLTKFNRVIKTFLKRFLSIFRKISIITYNIFDNFLKKT